MLTHSKDRDPREHWFRSKDRDPHDHPNRSLARRPCSRKYLAIFPGKTVQSGEGLHRSLLHALTVLPEFVRAVPNFLNLVLDGSPSLDVIMTVLSYGRYPARYWVKALTGKKVICATVSFLDDCVEILLPRILPLYRCRTSDDQERYCWVDLEYIHYHS
ncbi:uncharacterized protein ARMOST_20609 [Armillaria ostoyae]|uniref:Uncharacterized protein n=1 Tax=Armillaria ostoyae TaxID=47428 RepID=A0A284S7T2_ARMOS|nr:uncharacterized protein ARMOST_20609 [Armillaria ostoyae]